MTLPGTQLCQSCLPGQHAADTRTAEIGSGQAAVRAVAVEHFAARSSAAIEAFRHPAAASSATLQARRAAWQASALARALAQEHSGSSYTLVSSLAATVSHI